MTPRVFLFMLGSGLKPPPENKLYLDPTFQVSSDSLSCLFHLPVGRVGQVMSVKFDTSKWGEIGSSIRGSKLVRDYCVRCGEPIRVVSVSPGVCCLDCHPTGRPGKSNGRSTHDAAVGYHGGRFYSGEW